MKEIIYGDIDVPYDFGWSFNEGIDQLTVNNDLNAAVADRLNLQAQAKTRLFNGKLGAYLVASAAADLGAVDDVNKVLRKLPNATRTLKSLSQFVHTLLPKFTTQSSIISW